MTHLFALFSSEEGLATLLTNLMRFLRYSILLELIWRVNSLTHYQDRWYVRCLNIPYGNLVVAIPLRAEKF